MGYVACCPSTPIPSPLTMTVVFSPGTNSATYFDVYQSTTLTYFVAPPGYATGVYNQPHQFYSPVLTDALGETFYYILICNLGQFALGQQLTPPFFGASTAVRWGASPCSPFLLTPIIRPLPGYLGGFGATGSSDDIVVSP